MSQYGTSARGICRPGMPAHHSSIIQSFHALDARGGELLVGRLEERAAGEAGEAREAHLGVDAVDVHVGDAVGDRVAARAHRVVRRGVEAVVLAVLAGDRVEADARVGHPVVHPDVVALGGVHDRRTALLELLGQAVLEHVRVLDHVVVDRHDLYVVLQRHECPSSSCRHVASAFQTVLSLPALRGSVAREIRAIDSCKGIPWTSIRCCCRPQSGRATSPSSSWARMCHSHARRRATCACSASSRAACCAR